MCVCVCERERESVCVCVCERETVCVSVTVCVCVCVSVTLCVCETVCVTVCVCVCMLTDICLWFCSLLCNGLCAPVWRNSNHIERAHYYYYYDDVDLLASSHNWNTLFVNADAVATWMAAKYQTDKSNILDDVRGVCCVFEFFPHFVVVFWLLLWGCCYLKKII